MKSPELQLQCSASISVILTERDPVSWFRSVRSSLTGESMIALHRSIYRYAMMLDGTYYSLTMGRRACEILGIGFEVGLILELSHGRAK